MTRDHIIKEIKKHFNKSSNGFLTQLDFIAKTNISKGTIRYHFGSWNEALEAADVDDPELKSVRANGTLEVSDSELLNDLYLLYQETKKEPNEYLIKTRCRFPSRIYKRKWGTINTAFLEAQKLHSAEKSVEQLLENTNVQISKSLETISTLETNPMNQIKTTSTNGKVATSNPEAKNIAAPSYMHAGSRNKIIFGEPIHFRGVTYGPTNEQGVLSLFSMVSAELGYNIERIQNVFPKGEAKRCFDRENNWWEHVRIEFLYKSSEFYTRGYDMQGCDLVVCWIHDWDACPIEIFDLSAYVKQVQQG